MSARTYKRRSSSASSRADVYEEVTARIVAALEEGTVPWRQPWRSLGGPRNLRSGRAYRGVNVLLLELESAARGYSDPRWGTFKAVKEAGGTVRRGEHGTRVILWKPCERKSSSAAAEGEEELGRSYLLLRTFVVFNAEQCDGLAPFEGPELLEHERDERAELVVSSYCRGTGPELRHEGDRAYYSPQRDRVTMPAPELFESSGAYYQTLWHELVHSSGHESRLDRLEPATFGSAPYAREELVAELGAAMLAGITGAGDPNGDQSPSYIAGWLRALRDDRKLIVQAAAAAQKASDLVLGDTLAELEPAEELEPSEELETAPELVPAADLVPELVPALEPFALSLFDELAPVAS